MIGQLYMVTRPTPYASSMGYSRRIGASNYDSVRESKKMSGYDVVLIFEDQSTDGFRLSELTRIS